MGTTRFQALLCQVLSAIIKKKILFYGSFLILQSTYYRHTFVCKNVMREIAVPNVMNYDMYTLKQIVVRNVLLEFWI